MPKKRKKVLKPLPEVPEAKTSLSVYLWLAVDTSFQTYWQGKQTNKQFTLSRRNNQVINLPSTEKGHIVYSRQITKYIAMSEHETAIPRKDRIWFLVLNLPFCHPSQLTQNLWMLSSLLFIVFTKFYQVLKRLMSWFMHKCLGTQIWISKDAKKVSVTCTTALPSGKL